MALLKYEDYYPNYRDTFGERDIKGMDVYASDPDDKVGHVDSALVDETDGRFRYLIVDTGFWFFGKKVLVPIGRTRMDFDDNRVEIPGLSKDQVENLPEFSEDLRIDGDYEERVRGVYRPTTVAPATPTAPAAPAAPATPAAYDRNTYNYNQEPELYGLNERDHQTLRLYEERLIADKARRKTGEVTVGKHVETETARVAVPVEKERVIVERTTPDNRHPVDPNSADFREGEVARVEVYEESPEIRKEAFVREEVNVRKEVDRDTVTAEDTVRREELDIDTDTHGDVRRF